MTEISNYRSGHLDSESDNFKDKYSNTEKKRASKPQLDLPKGEKTGTTSNETSKYRVGNLIEDGSKETVNPKKNSKSKVPNYDQEPHKAYQSEPKSLLGAMKTEKDIKSNLSANIKKSIKKGLSEETSQPQSLNSASQIWPLESGRHFEAYEKLMESKGMERSAHEIEAENKQLRQFLKSLNENLKHQLDRLKVTDYEGKKMEFRNKSSEEQIKTIVRELANNEKILAINKEEFKKAEARLATIKDASYVMNIDLEISKLHTTIDAIKKENKRLELKNGNIGKDLDKIENVKGVPTNITEAHEKDQEAKKLAHKLFLLKQKNSMALEEKNKKLDKEKSLASEIRKLENLIAGVPLVSEEMLQKNEKIRRQAYAMEDDLRNTDNNCKFKVNQSERELDELRIQCQKEEEHVEKLEEVLIEQAAALKQAVSTTELASKHNKATQEMLDHIKTSLDTEPKRSAKSPGMMDEVGSGRNISIGKNKSIAKGMRGRNDMQLDPIPKYGDSKVGSFSVKHKNAVKRELGEKKSMWKEENVGERARMDHLVDSSNLKTVKRTEETNEFSKPSRLIKAPKETGKSLKERREVGSPEKRSTNVSTDGKLEAEKGSKLLKSGKNNEEVRHEPVEEAKKSKKRTQEEEKEKVSPKRGVESPEKEKKREDNEKIVLNGKGKEKSSQSPSRREKDEEASVKEYSPREKKVSQPPSQREKGNTNEVEEEPPGISNGKKGKRKTPRENEGVEVEPSGMSNGRRGSNKSPRGNEEEEREENNDEIKTEVKNKKKGKKTVENNGEDGESGHGGQTEREEEKVFDLGKKERQSNFKLDMKKPEKEEDYDFEEFSKSKGEDSKREAKKVKQGGHSTEDKAREEENEVGGDKSQRKGNDKVKEVEKKNEKKPAKNEEEDFEEFEIDP